MNKLSERQIFERSITEDDVFGACRTLLELNGARVFRVRERIPWGPKGKKSEPGIPDGFGWFVTRARDRDGQHIEFNERLDGRPTTFFIEFKRPFKAQIRPAQIRWIEQARRDGVVAFFADSVDAMVKGFKEFGIHLKGV
jgi:hypothetical protein